VSIQEERELRERLGGLLDEVRPRQAPVIAAVRQGRWIRMRRRIAVGAGLAVLACGAALTPALLHAVSSVPPSAPRVPHYSETVSHLPRQARHGVIGSGTEDGHRWQVTLSGTGSSLGASGTDSAQLGMGTTGGDSPNAGSTFGGSTPGFMVTQVSTSATDMRIFLPGGKTVDLFPVRYAGQNWVALELPGRVFPVRAETFAGSRELNYSIATPINPALANWWLPGQTAPAKFTGLIGSGVVDGQSWSVTAMIGPWGYCYQGLAGGVCASGLHPPQFTVPRDSVSELTCGPVRGYGNSGPSDGIAVAGSGAREAELSLSGGGTERFPVVNVAGTQMFAFAFPERQHVTRITVFGASGQVVATAAGSSLTC
jgi:hypothetical protein